MSYVRTGLQGYTRRGTLSGYLGDQCTVDSNGQRVCTSIDTIPPTPTPMYRRWIRGPLPPVYWNGGGSGVATQPGTFPANLTPAQLQQLQFALSTVQQPATPTPAAAVDPSSVSLNTSSSFDFSSIPTWGWIALALGGFMLLRR